MLLCPDLVKILTVVDLINVMGKSKFAQVLVLTIRVSPLEYSHMAMEVCSNIKLD